MNAYTWVVSRAIFPLHERLKGHDSVAIGRALEASQWLPPERLRALQAERLRLLLAQVARSVPYYRDLFRDSHLRAEDFETVDSLAALPPIDKTVIRAHAARWTAEGASGLVPQQTSGSSGEPLHFGLSRHRIAFDIAAKRRATRWWGLDAGDPEIVLWGSSLELGTQDRLRQWRDRLFRSRLIPARALDDARLDEILRELRAFRPRMLFGYPSALARLAFRARETGFRVDDVGIAVAFCTSEVLRPEWRAAIAAAFGCGVANEYGARDAGFIALECPAGGLHVTAEELIVEAVDDSGRCVPAGEEGELVVTNLAGPEFPFIRYRTGDRGILSDRACPCGRGLPLIESIQGRANDGLISTSGAWIHGSAVNHVLREMPGLRAYRVVQESLSSVKIQLALERPLAPVDADRLARHVRRLLGEAVRVGMESVAQIPPEPNGKFRHIVCLVERPAAAPSGPPVVEDRA